MHSVNTTSSTFLFGPSRQQRRQRRAAKHKLWYNKVGDDSLEDEFCSDENFPEKATTSSDKDVTRCIVKLIVRKMTLKILWKRKASVSWFGK